MSAHSDSAKAALTDLKAAARALKAAEKAAETLADAESAGLEHTWPDAVPAARALIDAIDGLGGFMAQVQGVAAWGSDVGRLAHDAEQEARAAFARTLDTALAVSGTPLSGRSPELRWGLFTLVLGGQKPEAELWFGPRIDRIGRFPLDAARVAEALRRERAALWRDPFDDAAFVRELYTAYTVACARAGVAAPAPVRLTDVLREVAVGRQGPDFTEDPASARFVPYGRAQLAVDLGRLRQRRLESSAGVLELHLGVATREQTRRGVDHLWVPHVDRGDGTGTHFATLLFRKAA